MSELDEVRAALGAGALETTLQASRRVVAERDAAQARKQTELDELKRRLGLAHQTLTAHCQRRDEQIAEINRLNHQARLMLTLIDTIGAQHVEFRTGPEERLVHPDWCIPCRIQEITSERDLANRTIESIREWLGVPRRAGWENAVHDRIVALKRAFAQQVDADAAALITDGIELFAAERQRQIEVKGWTPEHDDQHDHGELVLAARCYAFAALLVETGTDPDAVSRLAGKHWPWASVSWRPSTDVRRNLAKAGALLAAEADRLKRL